MFGALMSAMLIIYAVAAVGLLLALPTLLFGRNRRALRGEESSRSSTSLPSRSAHSDQDTQGLARMLVEEYSRIHDRITDEWLTHLQNQRSDIEVDSDGTHETVDPVVEKRLLDSFEDASAARLDPDAPHLDQYRVGIYASRVRDLDTSWRAYLNALK